MNGVQITKKHESILGKPLITYRLAAPCGAYIEVCNYGARWLSAVIPDKFGVLSETLLGYDSAQGWLKDPNYMGATIGRFANRIGDACFQINGFTYNLDKNDGNNCNHGGNNGLSFQFFDSEIIDNSVEFSYFSPAFSDKFPGNLRVRVRYEFTDDFRVRLTHALISDSLTPAGLTNHAYFNLGGKLLNHQLKIYSHSILETNEEYIPTGQILSVENTPFDFSSFHAIGERIRQPNVQFKWNRGYNHCYPLFGALDKAALRLAAELESPESGRSMKLYTDYPSLLAYSGGFLSSEIPCRFGRPLEPEDGIALEAQFYPDSPRKPDFPDCWLKPGTVRTNRIEYQFGFTS